MTPKEKAEEILDKFDLETGLMSRERKQCALILVESILTYTDWHYLPSENLNYWEEVKQEIEKL